ncbi:hypothetical protein ACIQPQ_34290 [Streptomyces sp. NPDC091281]|uniref:hypothetical protein n=1 Tax=Streptomyces sp. NPDC091281 TaxID=3365985 RepID=UPI00380257AD
MASTDDDPPPASIVEQRDASALEQWDLAERVYRRWDCGALVEERPFTAAENGSADQQVSDTARQANRAVLLERARTAFTANAAYLAKVAAGTATNVDHLAQVPALTRQTQALVRLIVGGDFLDNSPPGVP